MNKGGGFTLLEVMVVVMILGILTATAFPVYKTVRSRAVGAEAASMMKQILDGEITYYLEHDKFFPDVEKTITILSEGTEDQAGAILDVRNALKTSVEAGRHLDYTISNHNIDGFNFCLVTIDSSDFMPLFKGGFKGFYAALGKEGSITYSYSFEDLLAALGE